METLEIWLVFLTVVLLGCTVHAWRLGNEKRDVAFLGATSVLCGAGAAAVVLL
ncbi:hypothetical protein [Azohydromonas australica]|uniref:hypothetical protein n=1 Tax=Azohydromonas australica TaxID=364039 RepID=UPI0003F6DA87|nr:hypothetical protein [Azohydromonas australica]